MARTLKQQIGKQGDFACAEEEAILNIMRTAAMLGGREQAFFKPYGLSPASYNLLRILRGRRLAGETQGVRASEIGCQMVVRMPDVTRLVDRLESMRLAGRHACAGDKRVKYVRITGKGLGLLASLDAPVERLAAQQLGHLSRVQLGELSRLCELARREDERVSRPGSSGDRP